MSKLSLTYHFDTPAELAAHIAGSGKPAASGSTPTKDVAAPKKPKNSKEAVQAKMGELKEKTSADVCRALIAEINGAPIAMKDFPEEKFDALFDAAVAKLAAAAEEL